MFSRNFLVERCKVDTERSTILWNGKEKKTLGHLLCCGEGYRFMVYFLEKGDEIPVGNYLPEDKLSAIFIPRSEMDNYIALLNVEEPVYAYINTDHPELNCLSVNEPVREFVN